MMPAAKHGDPQMGVDIHLCVVPPSPSPVPLPTPHMSVVFDPFDYIPIIGGTVTVCGMKRATAGTNGMAVHIPPGFPFAPKLPDKDDELFMGSATVVADGDPFSHIGHPVLACQVVGMMSPIRPKKKGGPMAMVLPTVFNLAIPTNVFIGGPPTISLMGLAFKGVFAALGKFAKSGLFRRIRQRLFRNLRPGFLKCTILRAEPVNILTGEVSLEHEDFVLPGRMPIEWSRVYSSENDHHGMCGHGWETMADIRLEVDPGDGVVTMRHPTAGPLLFGRLPVESGEKASELEIADGATLTDHGDEYRVRTKEDRVYHFSKDLTRSDRRGRLQHPIQQITDLCGNALQFEYRAGELTAIAESAGRRIELTTDAGRITEAAVTVPGANFKYTFARYQYDGNGDLVAVLDALGNPYRFDYDEHRMTRHTNRNGLSFRYEYEKTTEGWRVIHTWGDGGLYDYRFHYEDVLNERRITDSLGGVTVVKLDERGLPIAEIDPLEGITVYEYDDAGRTTAVVDPAGRRTEYHFDAAGNLLKLVRPDGAATTTSYSDQHKPLRVESVNGGTWTHRYDERGLLVELTTPLRNVVKYEYDRWGQLVVTRNARGALTTQRFDRWGNVAQVTDALGHSLRVAHDALGQLITREDALGQRTDYRYDPKCRVVGATLPSGATIACAYDPADNLTAFVHEDGSTTRLEYVGLGNIGKRIQPDGHVVECRYDTEERLIGVANQRGETYQLLRDPLGRVIEEVDYWGQSRRYTYDSAGRLTRTVDPLGRAIEYTCDQLGRITRRQWQEPGDENPRFEAFVYNAMGYATEAANEHAAIVREFDVEGQLLKEVQAHKTGQQFTIENTYDAQGNRVARKTTAGDGRGHTIEFTFDLLDQMTGASIDGDLLVRAEYDSIGRVARERFAEAVVRRLRYNTAGDLTQQSVTRGDNRLFGMRYDYDVVGNLTRRHDTHLGADRYTYDPMGRVLEHVGPTRMVHKFVTDPAGDRLVSQVTRSRDASPNERDDWRREGQFLGASWRFDRAGNLTTRRSAEQRLDLVWDTDQHLVASRRTDRSGASAETTYGYDSFGRRLFKETAGERTWFGWDGETMCVEARNGDAREFVYRPETFEPLALVADGRMLFVNDPNGAPTRLVDEQGEIRWAAHHSMLTLPPADGADVENPIRLQNQYADPETQLLYNRTRYFDADLGQFISQDPVRLVGGSHLYAYGPNPLGWTDPLGLNPKCRMTGRAVTAATDLPVVRPGTRAWDQAVDALRRGGRGDIRVDTIQDAKRLLREARGNMDRRRNYTNVPYTKGYEVHNVHNPTSRARELGAGNDLRHVKWRDDSPEWAGGHIYFGDPL